MRIDLAPRASCWIEATADGERVIYKLLNVGDHYAIEGYEDLILKVGDPSALVYSINGATGRDERRFADPDRYDVGREIDFHLGFGYGRHICLGASLARMESRIGIEEFLRRWPEYEIPTDGAVRMHSSNVRGFSGLIIEAM